MQPTLKILKQPQHKEIICINLKQKIQVEYDIWKSNIFKNKLEVTEDDILKLVSKSSGIPIEKISDKTNKILLSLNDHLSSKIIGQDEAIDKISLAIQRNRVGIRRKNRTVGNFIF